MTAIDVPRLPSSKFREYLESIPDDLLQSVAEDYIWLSTLPFHNAGRSADFVRRRECCREECARRGVRLAG